MIGEFTPACAALHRNIAANVADGSFSTDPAGFACRFMSGSP
jgi:hypothetical protein